MGHRFASVRCGLWYCPAFRAAEAPWAQGRPDQGLRPTAGMHDFPAYAPSGAGASDMRIPLDRSKGDDGPIVWLEWLIVAHGQRLTSTLPVPPFTRLKVSTGQEFTTKSENKSICLSDLQLILPEVEGLLLSEPIP